MRWKYDCRDVIEFFGGNVVGIVWVVVVVLWVVVDGDFVSRSVEGVYGSRDRVFGIVFFVFG